MKVYIVSEYWHEYAEEGGGLQGVKKVFSNLGDAIAYQQKMEQEDDDYSYFIKEWVVE